MIPANFLLHNYYNKRKKKNRIDVYYIDVMNYENKVDSLNEGECRQAIKEIRALKSDAFQQLVDEKLIADESFQIFINLADNTIGLLERRIQQES